MTRLLGLSTIAVLAAQGAFAGGIERTSQSVGVIFKEGNYLEFSLGSVSPDVSGVQIIPTGPIPAGSSSGNMTESYTSIAMAFKQKLSDNIDVALIYDQPLGASVFYPVVPYFAAGSVAQYDSTALTGVIQYTFENNFSVYGGLRYQTAEANVSIPFVDGYSGVAEADSALGWLAGVAYERPDIALRVALSYNSAMEFEHDVVENSGTFGAGRTSTMDVTAPQSVNLEFQSGIAPDTLLFGSVRWVEWTEFDVTPDDYFTLTGGGSLVSYDDDVFTYNLGIGRRLNENWSVAASAGYEKANGGLASNLGPTDGFWSFGVGATYTQGNTEVQFGVRYVEIGDAETTITGAGAQTSFEDNSAIGVGVKVGISF